MALQAEEDRAIKENATKGNDKKKSSLRVTQLGKTKSTFNSEARTQSKALNLNESIESGK